MRNLPLYRAQCEPGGSHYHRPCPYVSCRHHLLLDVTASGVLQFPHGHACASKLGHTCSLDVASDGAQLPDVVASLTGLSPRSVGRAGDAAAAVLRAMLAEYSED